MYLIDITRQENKSIINDRMLSNSFLEAREKIVKYIKNYIFANYNNIDVDYSEISDNLNMKYFSLKNFLLNNNGILLDDDLIIQTINLNKNYSLAFKTITIDTDINPSIYVFDTNERKEAKHISKILVKDILIQKFGVNDQLDLIKDYEDFTPSFNDYSMQVGNDYFYWYDSMALSKDLLNNELSYSQILNNKNLEIHI